MAYQVVLSVSGYSQVIDEFRSSDDAFALAREKEASGSWQVTIITTATGTAYTPNGFAEAVLRPLREQKNGP